MAVELLDGRVSKWIRPSGNVLHFFLTFSVLLLRNLWCVMMSVVSYVMVCMYIQRSSKSPLKCIQKCIYDHVMKRHISILTCLSLPCMAERGQFCFFEIDLYTVCCMYVFILIGDIHGYAPQHFTCIVLKVLYGSILITSSLRLLGANIV